MPISQIVTSFVLSLLFSLSSVIFGAKNPIKFDQKSGSIVISVKIATPSAFQNLPTNEVVVETTKPAPMNNPTPTPNVPWGTTEKVGDHLYRTFVANESVMGTPDEIVTALNNYRQDHNTGPLRKYDPLCGLAQSRAEEQDKMGTLDGHKGLEDYFADENHWKDLNITGVGENASYGYVLSGIHLIEWVFDSDSEHRANQLKSDWTLVCPGVSGKTVDVLFAKN